jgi:hypothetical protein
MIGNYTVTNDLNAKCKKFLVYKVTILALPKPKFQAIPAVRTIKDRFACITPHETTEGAWYWNGTPQLLVFLLNTANKYPPDIRVFGQEKEEILNLNKIGSALKLL